MSQSLFVCGLLALFNFFVAGSAAPRLAGLGLSTRWIWAAFLLFYALQIVAPLLDWHWLELQPARKGMGFLYLVRFSYLCIGLMSCLFVYMALADVFSLAARWLLPVWPSLVWDRLIVAGALLLLLSVISLGTYHLWPPVVEKVDVSIKGLPDAFDGLRIVQLTDLHVGTFLSEKAVRYAVAQTQSLQPDLIVVTGDLIDGAVARRLPDLAPLRALQAPLGQYFVTGNHEYYWNAQAWEAAARSLGLTVLTNQNVVLRRGGAQVVLAGVPDITSLRLKDGPQTDPQAALAGAPSDAVKILLAHQPVVWPAAAAAGYDLMLSGHTHGGQYFPFTFIIRAFQPLLAGLYRQEGAGGKDLWVYVNRGTGFWGPPLRTTRPEITLLTLRKAS